MQKTKKGTVKLVVADEEGVHEFDGNGMVACVMKRSKKDLDDLSCVLLGTVTDEELLIMLRFLLDKMRDSIEDEVLASDDLTVVLASMHEEMLTKGKGISEGPLTVQ